MVGDKVPSLFLPVVDRSGIKTVNIEDVFKDRTTLLIGHPGAFTHISTHEQIPDYDKYDTKHQIVLWSVNDPYVLRRYRDKYNIRFPMISDFNGTLTRTFELGLPEELYFTYISKRVICLMKDTLILGVSSEENVKYTKATKPSMAQHLSEVVFNY